MYISSPTVCAVDVNEIRWLVEKKSRLLLFKGTQIMIFFQADDKMLKKITYACAEEAVYVVQNIIKTSRSSSKDLATIRAL